MPAVHSSWSLSFFDNSWFFKLHKEDSCSNSPKASPVEDKLTGAAVGLKDDQPLRLDFVDDLQSRSPAVSVAVPFKDYSTREDCGKATLTLETVNSGFEEMKRVFESLEENIDDRICGNDLRRYMARLGYEMSEKEARSMVASVDRDGDGRIDFDELFSLYQSLMDQQEEDEEESLLEAFQVFDKNADGFITAGELQAVLLDLGMPEGKNLKTCEEMIRSVAADGGGEIDIGGFKQMMRASSLRGTVCH